MCHQIHNKKSTFSIIVYYIVYMRFCYRSGVLHFSRSGAAFILAGAESYFIISGDYSQRRRIIALNQYSEKD